MKKITYSKEISSAIHCFLTNDSLPFSFDEEKGIFQFDLHGRDRFKRLAYTVKVNSNGFVVYAASPIGADADNQDAMLKMAEFICRANYGILNGGLELDMLEGDIRYKYYVDCADEIAPTNLRIRSSIYYPASMLNGYAPGIANIIFNGSTAVDALMNCEEPIEGSPYEPTKDAIDDPEVIGDIIFSYLMSQMDSSNSASEDIIDIEAKESN